MNNVAGHGPNLLSVFPHSCHRRHTSLPAAFTQLGIGSEHRNGSIPRHHAEPLITALWRDHPQEGGPTDEKQGGSTWVSQEKERVRQMSGKSCGSVGKPKQDPDWRAESTKRHLLPQSRVAAAVCGQELKTVPFTNCYSKTRLAKNSGTKTALNVFVSLLTQAWFTLNSEVNLDIQTAWACQFRSCCYLLCALCMWRLKCRTHYACCCFCARQWEPAEEEEEEIQVLPENVPLKYRDYEKTLVGQPGLATSKFLWGQTRCTQCYSDPPAAATTQLSHVYLICHLCHLRCRSWLFPAFLYLKTQLRRNILKSILSVKWSPVFHQLVFSLYSSWFDQKGFSSKWTRRSQDEDPLMFGSLYTEFQNIF